jgi:hypothetical protein
MTKYSKISAITIMIFLGFCASVVFHYYQGSVLKKPYPNNTFLFYPADRFADFYTLPSINFDLNPYFRDTPSAQYPLVNIFGYLFSLLPNHLSFLLYAILVSASVIFITIKILWEEKNQDLHFPTALVLVFLTYPFLFTMDRGNIESLLFVFLFLFMFYFRRNRYTTSAIFLSVAIAMKLYPALFLLLYFPQKKYREVILSVSLTALLTLGSLAMFKNGFLENALFLLRASNFSSNEVLSLFLGSNNFVQRGVSLFTFFKIIFIETDLIASINMRQFLSIYYIAMACLFVPLAGYVVFIEKKLWKQVTLLTFAMLLFPHISADYKLLHVYLPMFLFLIAEKDPRSDIFYLISFGLLMIPKNYIYFPKVMSDSGTSDIGIAVMINILVMVFMSLWIILTGSRNFIKNAHA